MRQVYSGVKNKPIVSEEDGKSYGCCNDCIIDFDKGIVAACTVTPGSLLNAKHSVLLLVDVRGIDDVIRINSGDAITPAEEIVRLNELLALPHSLMMVPAFTEMRRNLGYVLDFAFDDVSGLISEVHIGEKHLLRGPQIRYIVPRSAILKLASDGVIVKEGFIAAAQEPVSEEEFTKQPGFNPEPA